MFSKKSLIVMPVFGLLVAACGGGSSDNASENKSAAPQSMVAEEAKPADSKGIGKFSKVDLGASLDQAMAAAGEKVYDVKCGSCHKLTEEKLVGPGWKGVTGRHTPEWIMNFSTNVDEMLNKDPKAMTLLEECLVRMPNQNLSDDDARHVLEFMRKNDGVK